MKIIFKAHPTEVITMIKSMFDAVVKTDERGARVEVELARFKIPPIPLVLKATEKEEKKHES